MALRGKLRLNGSELVVIHHEAGVERPGFLNSVRKMTSTELFRGRQ